jgi:hypothetical protein
LYGIKNGIDIIPVSANEDFPRQVAAYERVPQMAHSLRLSQSTGRFEPTQQLHHPVHIFDALLGGDVLRDVKCDAKDAPVEQLLISLFYGDLSFLTEGSSAETSEAQAVAR